MKRFYEMYNVGKSKYVINYHDGVKKHADGSDFYDISIFKSKKKMEEFKKSLIKKGYYDRNNIPVIFRILKGEVIAFFPTIENGSYIMSYMHVGQHSDADPTLINELKPATKKQYKELYDELVSIGYTDMVVHKENVFN